MFTNKFLLYMQFFQKGSCKNGSACSFRHSMDRDGAEPAPFDVHGLPTHQVTSLRLFLPKCERLITEFLLLDFHISLVLTFSFNFDSQARSSDRRASESNWRFDERRHETGSSSRPEKRVTNLKCDLLYVFTVFTLLIGCMFFLRHGLYRILESVIQEEVSKI